MGLAGDTSAVYIGGMEKRPATVEALIDALHGPTKAAAALGERAPQVIVNWRLRNKLPTHRYRAHRAALNALGIHPPDDLWFGPLAPSEETGAPAS